MSARRDLNKNAPSIALVGKTGREAKSFKRIECAAYSRLPELQRFGKATHGVRSRIQRNTQENSGLSYVKIRTIRTNSFGKNVLQKGKRGIAIHVSSNQPAPHRDSLVFVSAASGTNEIKHIVFSTLPRPRVIHTQPRLPDVHI